jgi:hypothetical protein
MSASVVRFEIGQHVVINDVISSRHLGKKAVIVEAHANRKRIRTLDKYVVKFADGETAALWSIQLDDLERLRKKIG